MIDLDLEDMTIKELKELVRKAEAVIARRSASSRNEALEKFKAIAAEYDLSVEAVLGLERVEKKGDAGGSIPTSALTMLLKLAPNGLYNPKAPEGAREWGRRKETGRWMPINSWIKEEIGEILNQNAGQLPEKEMKKMVSKFQRVPVHVSPLS